MFIDIEESIVERIKAQGYEDVGVFIHDLSSEYLRLTPMKPVQYFPEDGHEKIEYRMCPTCKERVCIYQDAGMCEACGQALDWSDVK